MCQEWNTIQMHDVNRKHKPQGQGRLSLHFIEDDIQFYM